MLMSGFIQLGVDVNVAVLLVFFDSVCQLFLAYAVSF
jgi:hypothetical protein